MNFWATLEHEARYKYQSDVPQHLSDELVLCADKIAELDHRMFLIHENIKGRSNEITAEILDDKNLKQGQNKPLRARELRRSFRGLSKSLKNKK